MASFYAEKDPDAVLDYKFDWSSWLASGETISTISVAADSGLTVDSSSRTDTNTSVTAWLSGGTVGQTYGVRCRVTTSESRTDDRTLNVTVKER